MKKIIAVSVVALFGTVFFGQGLMAAKVEAPKIEKIEKAKEKIATVETCDEAKLEELRTQRKNLIKKKKSIPIKDRSNPAVRAEIKTCNYEMKQLSKQIKACSKAIKINKKKGK